MRTLRSRGRHGTRRGGVRDKQAALDKKAAKEQEKAAKKAAKEQANEERAKRTLSAEKTPPARAMKDQEDKRLLEILQRNIDARNESDDAVLDSPTLPTYPDTIRSDIEILTDNDRVVAPMKVTVAAVFGKLAYPDWDTRKHQVGIGGLRSLRTLDHSFVASTLYRMGLYRTATEGILTRSFESKHPFTMDYPGEIKPVVSKNAFLRIVNRINDDPSQTVAETILRYFLKRLHEQKERVAVLSGNVVVATSRVSLKTLRDLLQDVFGVGAGMSATPAIVTHTAFSLIQPHLWEGVQMAPLKRHTASDSTSKAIGDVEGYKGDAPFVSVEIKYNIDIDDTMIRTFSTKTGSIPLRYMLTTRGIRTKFTDENILIGNVTDVVLQCLHGVMIHDADICATFATRLREALIASPDIGSSNKTKIADAFTKLLAPPSPE
jgi:hypothetical protein